MSMLIFLLLMMLTVSAADNYSQVTKFDLKVKVEETESKVETEQQEERVISGQVTDEAEQPLPGVTVVVVGTTIGTITNSDGEFTLTIPADSEMLRFSFVGMAAQEVSAIGKSTFDVVMQEESIGIEEVVAVGYAQQSKVTITGSVSGVGEKELKEISTPSLGEGILGRTPGLQMTQTEGTPGLSDPGNLYIRGLGTFNAKEPLFIIDGVPSSRRDFMQINPSSVRDISILKDASATAVYGVRGANGVMIVTTRRGMEGRLLVDASASYGMQQVTKIIDLADSYQWSLAYNQQLTNDGRESGFVSDEAIEHYRLQDLPGVYPSTDWVDEVIDNYAPISRGNVSISGGSEKIQYFNDFSFLSQDGMVKTFGPRMEDFKYNRINTQTNIDVEITPTTHLNFTSRIRLGDRKEPLHAATTSRGLLWGRMYSIPPMNAAGEIDGKFVKPHEQYLPPTVESYSESFAQYLWAGNNRTVTENRYNLNLDFKQSLKAISDDLDGLDFRAKIAYRSGFDRTKRTMGGYSVYHYARLNKDFSFPDPNLPDDEVVYERSGEPGNRSFAISYSPSRYIYWEGGFDYEQSFGEHDVTGLILYTQEKDYYPPGSWAYSNIATGNVGLVGRINYNFSRRYMAEVNVGYNGSENFAPENRYGFFPSVSLGWVMSDENFMQNISFLDNLKWRFSYGLVGSDQAGGGHRFTYIGTSFTRDVSKFYGYNFGDDIPEFRPGVHEEAVGNTDITWETARKQNYGVDTEFFNSRLMFSMDYFYEYRDDILITRASAPDFLGMNLPAVNLGEIENEGFDIAISWQDQVGDFIYEIDGNVSRAKNTILYMDEITPVEPYQLRTGSSMNMPYGYTWDGYYTEDEVAVMKTEIENEVEPEDRTYAFPTGANVEAGDMKYVDLNEDGVVDQIDQKPIGYPTTPQIIGGLNGRFSYKGFDMSFGFQGVTQVSRYLPFRQPFGSANRDALWEPWIEGSWTPERAEAGTVEFPRFTVDSKNYNAYTSTYAVRDGSYIRLRRLELGYTFENLPAVQNLRVFVNGSNLITFQKDEYRWFDPEPSSTSVYPLLKFYYVGANITF